MTGEERHETCRFGVFSAEAHRLDATCTKVVAFAMPLCGWRPAQAPPALSRAWGGAIDMERDCSRCRVWAEVTIPEQAA